MTQRVRSEHVLRVVCGYETVALSTSRIPTVTSLCAKFPALIPPVVGYLLFHLINAATRGRR